VLATLRFVQPTVQPAISNGQNHVRQFTSSPSSSALSDYSPDALDAPLSALQPPPTSLPTAALQADLASAASPEQQERVEKARIVFGTRLASPIDRRDELDRASTLIAGVLVPPKPDEPDNCCMSGCVNCVWDLFRDELEDWAAKSKEARIAKGRQERERVDMVAGSMDSDGGGSEGLWQSGAGARDEEAEDLFQGVPVGIRAFMETEKRLKAAQRKAEAEKAG
jgi:hypothetical protein